MSRWLAGLGLLLSGVYLSFVFWLVGDRLGMLRTMELNAVGDFFAGIFGPLAILWLVLGFFQQGVELRQNNESLRLQAEELKNSVDQQKDLVDIAGRQLALEMDHIVSSRLANFVITTVYQNDFGSGRIYKFSFHNVGHGITDFHAEIEGSTTPQRKTSIVSKDSSCSHTFKFESAQGYFFLKLRYIDGNKVIRDDTYKGEFVGGDKSNAPKIELLKLSE